MIVDSKATTLLFVSSAFCTSGAITKFELCTVIAYAQESTKAIRRNRMTSPQRFFRS